jgi:hypothetical protein
LNRLTLRLLLLILLVGAAVRFHSVGERSLWEDEGWTLLLSAGPNAADIVQAMAYDQHPPLYFVLIRPWITLTGDSELALRSFSVLLGLLSIAAMFRLGHYAFSTRVGLLGASLLAVWDFAIDVAQDARQYGLLLFLVILSCAYFFRYQRHPTCWNGLGWWAASVLALYTQYTAGVVLGIQLIYIVVFGGKRRVDLLIRLGLICLAFAPWLPVFIRQNDVRWDDPIYYQSGLPNNSATFHLMRDALVSQQFGLVIGLGILGLAVVTHRPRARVRLPSPKTVFMALWVALYLGLFIYLNEQREILRLRIFILAVPPILLLVAQGLSNLQGFPQAFLLAVLLAVNLTSIDTRQNNPPWREVTQNVTDFHQAGERILMDNWVGDFSTRYYVEQQMGEDTPWLSLRELARSKGDFFLPELAAYLEGEDSFWLIRWNDDPEDYDGLLADLGFQRTASPYVEHEGNKLYSHRYDRLSETRLATFGGTIDLLKASVRGGLVPGAEITVQLWWTAREAPPLDYSVSVFLLDESGQQVGSNQDSPPLDGLSPTSAWPVGKIQFDAHDFTLPANLPSGRYRIAVRLYWYVEPDAPLEVTSEGSEVLPDAAIVAEFEIE